MNRTINRLQQLLTNVRDQDPDQAMVTTLGLEKAINTFFRLQNPSVIAQLQAIVSLILATSPDARTVFLKLRELRNSW